MAAEITLFKEMGSRIYPGAQVAAVPYQSKTATFTPDVNVLMRVWANGANVSLTVDSITWTVPNGSVEYFYARASKEVTIA